MVSSKTLVYDYQKVKSKLGLEPYLKRHRRSAVGRFRLRSGSNFLRSSTGRFDSENFDDRKCSLCSLGEVEDVHHFLIECELYSEFRDRLGSLFVEAVTLSAREAVKSAAKLNLEFMEKTDLYHLLLDSEMFRFRAEPWWEECENEIMKVADKFINLCSSLRGKKVKLNAIR